MRERQVRGGDTQSEEVPAKSVMDKQKKQWHRVQKGFYAFDSGELTIRNIQNEKLPWVLYNAAGTVLARCRTLTEGKGKAASLALTDTVSASERANPAANAANSQPTGISILGGSEPTAAKNATETFLVYTDGGCQPNPGTGGIGIVVINKATGEVQEVSCGYAYTTNNRMEVIALITALNMLPKNAEATVYSDSLYAINCWQRNWSREKNADLWPKLDAAAKGKHLTVRHVRGHAGDLYNERCDELATRGIASVAPLRDDGYLATNTYRGYPSALQPKRSEFQQPLPSLPNEFRSDDPDTSNAKTYAKQYQVLPGCAEGICTFYREGRRRFKDFAQLRVCGCDSYSAMDLTMLTEKTGISPDGIEYLKAVLGNVFLSALRWRCRGLTWEDSIRKVQVDTEIQANAAASRYRR